MENAHKNLVKVKVEVKVEIGRECGGLYVVSHGNIEGVVWIRNNNYNNTL